MRVLFIVGTCLSKNTSANMSHNSYIRGLVENGCEVDVIMKNDSWGQTDSALNKINGVNYIEFESTSWIDKIRIRARGNVSRNVADGCKSVSTDNSNSKFSTSLKLRSILKTAFYKLFPQDKVYPLDKKWISTTQKFRNHVEYDLVVSNSSPSASHKVAQLLIESGRVKTKRWVQIWEDPWSHDLYGNHSAAIENEERNLLEAASEIFYVSPLTTEYQKRYFPTAAHKMNTIPLPYFEIDDCENGSKTLNTPIKYGYFGDYYSHTRNLLPFFNAMNNSQRSGYIFGDTDLLLQSETVEISPRVTLDVLKNVQRQTSVLVHLSNLYGGQIPGKIYHYSATNKPILFILDGTDEEKQLLTKHFGVVNRYYFCDNTQESIMQAMDAIEREFCAKDEQPVLQYSPKEVVKLFL